MASLKEIEEAKLAAEALNQELGYLEDAFTSIGQKIKDDITYELIGQEKQVAKIGKVFSNNIGKALNENSRTLKNITSLQDKINSGVNVEAKIKKELENLETRRKTIKRQQNSLVANGIKLDEKLGSQLEANFNLQQDSLNVLIAENTERQKQKSLFTILGEGGKNLLDKLDKSGTASKLLGGNLKDTVTTTRLMEGAVALIIDSFLALDTQTAKVAESLGISYHEAQGMNKEFSQIAQNSNNIFVTTAGVANSQMELSKILGTNAMFTEEMLITQTALTHQLGLSAETSGEIAKLGLLTGKTSKEIAANVLGQSVAMNAANGTALTEQQILKDVAKLSSSIQLSMANNPIELAKAVQTAKQFGMELSQVDGIANSLMNFEQSIGAELEAELLLGKNINLEKARTAALNNDLATVAEEIAKQAGSAAEFTAMNRIQQEALAKAVGMSKDDLAKSLQDREILAALGGKDKTTLEAYNRLKKEGLSDEAIATKLGDKNLANSLHQESIQARFAASLNKVKELFVQIADLMLPIVEPIADAIGYMASLISKSMGFLKVLGGIAAVYKTINFLGENSNKISLKDIGYSNIKKGIQSRILLAKGSELGLVGKILVGLGLENAAKDYQIKQDAFINNAKKISQKLGMEGLGTKIKTSAITAKDFIKDKARLVIDKVRNAASFEGLGIKIKTSAITAKDFIVDKASLAFQYAKNAATFVYNGILSIGNAIKKSGLLASIAEMAMRAFSSLSAIPFIGPILGIAGAAAAAGLGYMYYSKADDMMSPGANSSGYGSRTLMGPEGAIALNNKDTVIAGTDLFKKGDDVVSKPAGSVSMAPDNSKMEKLLERAINRPDPVIKMNGDRLGTAVGKYAYSTQ